MMAANQPPPPKPWENRRLSADVMAGQLTRPGQPTLTRVPPPVLPRPSQQAGNSTLNTFRPAYSSSFSPGYGTYGNSFYGSYSPYSYGYGGLGYNRYRMDDIPTSRFVQQAEESSRGAFQSIESIVHAFASVSMMMDATFSAVYNSFRAVLDVANHFSRLKIHFTKVFSAFALVRTIRYLYRRLQRLLGMRKRSENEDLWAESEGTVACIGPEDKAANSAKSWPIFLFFAVVLGGPYLIWKLLSTYTDEETDVIRNKRVQVLSDNTTACYYLNKQGGTVSLKLCREATTLWNWAIANNVLPKAVHIAGESNTAADALSRVFLPQHEWSLNRAYLHVVFRMWGTPLVDLFATVHNTQAPLFCSRAGIGHRSLGDAFQIPWSPGLFYAFPPFPLLHKVLSRIRAFRTHCILIAPRWPRQDWFPLLLSLSQGRCLPLPHAPDLLLRDGVWHHDVAVLNLTAWLLCAPD
ncbi:peroxisome biogenesis factor 13 isoform X1 [Eublepharis macularius]|uniref:Peroxin-13 n=1 Tax=Eublepharis macularius TaxID=481883 RepID=A0AA97L5M4_EUBMA|nr:peroxisome biogenesis factor 13 isoform X1 [Eublepharis macularius]